MVKLIYFIALVALAGLLACGGDDATEAPADTPAQPTAVATAMPEPTATPEPAPTNTPQPTPTAAPTATPDPEPESTSAASPAPVGDPIRPLYLADPLSLAGELSEAEVACAMGVADLGKLMQIFSAPELAAPEEMTQLIDCMEDETVLRLFVTDLVGLEEPLSGEASACIRSGIDGADARAAMVAGMAGDAETAMTMSMSGFILTLSCLDDSEFAAMAPALGIPLDDREQLRCLLAEIGGPGQLVAATIEGDQEAMLALAASATACGVDMEGDPTGQTAPDDGEDAMTDDYIAYVISNLSDSELACLMTADVGQSMLQDPSMADSATQEQLMQILDCYEDDTIMDMFLVGIVGDPRQLSTETSACIRDGMQGTDIRGVIASASYEGEDSDMAVGMAATLMAVACLNEDEWEAAAPMLGFESGDRDALECVIENLGGLEEVAMLLQADDSGFEAFFAAASECGLPLMLGG